MENSAELLEKSSAYKSSDYFKIGSISAVERNKNQIKLILEKKELQITFLTSDIFRICMKDISDIKKCNSTPAVINHDLYYSDFEMEENNDVIEVTTDTLEIIITKEKFNLKIYNSNGELIHNDYSEYSLGWKKNNVRAWKELHPGDRFYGLGEKTGWFDKKGRKYEMWNHDTFLPHVSDTDPLYQSIPFLINFRKGRAHGIYFDNSYRSYFDLGSEGQDYYSFWAEGGKMDYYFINGPSLKEVVNNYSKLTGTMPLPPKWALGYHQSRYSYYPEEDVKKLVTNFREREIPCDAVHFDIHYMDEYRVYTWDDDKFPEPEKMISSLSDQGIKAVTIIDPGIKKDPQYKLYQEGMENDYFCRYLDGKLYIGEVWPGECAFPDFTQNKVREWWASLQNDFVKIGVKGIWNDMNEPAVFNDTDTMDLDVMHKNDGDPGTHRRFHNLYGFLEDKATYNGLKNSLENERPFVLTRAGFAGIQRYSAVWTGDNRSFWEHIKLAVPMLINMGLSGITFAGTDVGGFTGNSSGELLARWTQLGTFFPLFRNHCEVRAVNQEPWAFGEKYEKIIKEYIELRYKMITHIYNLFYKSSRSGIPVVRPLLMEYPEDEECYNLSDQFLFGDSIMVAPVYEPDRNKRMVYFPEGEWIDFWTGQSFKGPEYKIIDAPLSKLPIFLKAGSILPLNKKLNYIGEKELEELEFNIYLSNEIDYNNYRLYDDDGISFDYLEGKYNLTDFSYQINENKISLKIDKLEERYKNSFKSYNFKFHNLENLNNHIESVYANNEQIRDFDLTDNKLEFQISAEKL